MAKTKWINEAWLRKHGACDPGIAIFNEYYGKGYDIYLAKVIRDAHRNEEDDDAEWILDHVLNARLRQEWSRESSRVKKGGSYKAIDYKYVKLHLGITSMYEVK